MSQPEFEQLVYQQHTMQNSNMHILRAAQLPPYPFNSTALTLTALIKKNKV